ncbi:transposase [Myxococcus xanthus]
MGRPSIPPKQLLKACEQLDYNLLFRWFLNMGLEEASIDHSTFSANRTRLLEHDVARHVFSAVVGQAQRAGLTSSEHFSVDGTLIEAWASMKSFQSKGENKNKEAKLSYCLNGLMANRHGLLIDLRLLEARSAVRRSPSIIHPDEEGPDR